MTEPSVLMPDSEDQQLEYVYKYLTQGMFPPHIERKTGCSKTNMKRNFKKVASRYELSDDRTHLIKIRKTKGKLKYKKYIITFHKINSR